MVETGIIAILILGALAAAIAAAVIFRRYLETRDTENYARITSDFQKNLLELKNAFKDQTLELAKQMNDHLSQNNSFLRETHHVYSQSVSQLQHRLGQLHEATQSMLDIGKDISSLQSILQSPKLRGGLGELLLAELLAAILPVDHFALQHTFSTGAKVDAVIVLGDGMIPVDAKFPLENFKRLAASGNPESENAAKKTFIGDVKKHIDSIASKYILPEEGTFEFALMYIPAENVYYETIIKDEMQSESLAAYALRKKVVPVSPNSFYAYLQAIVRGLRGMKIEHSAKLILEGLAQLEGDFARCLGDMEKVGAHLSNAQSAYDKVEKRFHKMQGRLSSMGAERPPELGVDAHETASKDTDAGSG